MVFATSVTAPMTAFLWVLPAQAAARMAQKNKEACACVDVPKEATTSKIFVI